jgi:hypothetical protein
MGEFSRGGLDVIIGVSVIVALVFTENVIDVDVCSF